MQSIDAEAAAAALGTSADAVLLDVRTELEWRRIGIPDLAGMKAKLLCRCWVAAPGLPPDPLFAASLREAGIGTDQALYFLCRSGMRSAAAAHAAEAAGWTRCFNIIDGFEGNGALPGWRDRGLPVTTWPQD